MFEGGSHFFELRFWGQKYGESGTKVWRSNMNSHYSRNRLTQKHATEILRNAIKCTLPRCFEISTTHISLSSTRFILQFSQHGTKVWRSHTNANENARFSEISTRLILHFSLIVCHVTCVSCPVLFIILTVGQCTGTGASILRYYRQDVSILLCYGQ